MKTHILTEPAPRHEPAYLANGLVGLRVPPIPFLPQTRWRMALVNGFVEESDRFSTEAYAQAPYPLDVDLGVDGVFVSERPEMARFREQRLDFSCGELRSRFEVSVPEGPTATVTVLTFCSRSLPSVVLQRTAVEVDRPCRLTLQSRVEPAGLPGGFGLRTRIGGRREADVDWALRYDARGGLGALGMASRTWLAADEDARLRHNDWGPEADAAITELAVDARPHRPHELTQVAALVPSLLHGEPHWQAARICSLAAGHGFDALRAQNAEAWRTLWRGRPVLLGAEAAWQDTADAAFFYFHSSIHRGMPGSVAPFGLSRQTEYHGHVFWDTEGFMLPPALLTEPAAARAMLTYRSRTAPAARAMAQLHGHEGMLFPMQAGTRGDEVTVPWARAEAQHYAGMVVAWGFVQDVHATGDECFLRYEAWPVIEGVCRWIVSRTERTERGYELRHMRGPDETVLEVDNGGFMNGLAVHVLREAVTLAERLGIQPPPAWRRVAERMVLPRDESGALLKWDGWEYDGGFCGMEVPPLFHIYGFSLGPQADAATMRKYLPAAHHYVGMPMNSYNMAVTAAREGETDLARRFLDRAAGDRQRDPFMHFTEASARVDSPYNTDATVFITNAGALLTALLYGLPGLKWSAAAPEEWPHWRPALPDGWDGIACERIWARGRPMRLSAHAGEARARLEPLEEDAG